MMNDTNILNETDAPKKTYDEYKKEIRQHQSNELSKMKANISIVVALSLFWSIIFKWIGDDVTANICLGLTTIALVLGVMYWVVVEVESNKKLKKFQEVD